LDKKRATNYNNFDGSNKNLSLQLTTHGKALQKLDTTVRAVASKTHTEVVTELFVTRNHTYKVIKAINLPQVKNFNFRRKISLLQLGAKNSFTEISKFFILSRNVF
jgi:hypothetical protein